MIRIVYVPSSNPVSDGDELAIQHQLPIVHGKSKAIENISFDESKVQVLHIPELRGGGQSAQSIRCGFVLGIRFDDEFSDFTDSECFIRYSYEDSTEVINLNPAVKESHLLMFNIRPDKVGTISYEVVVDNNVVYSNMFGVL